MSEQRYEFKLVTLGDSGIGKSSIAFRMRNNKFEQMDGTIGAAFYPIKINGDNYQLWDTAGQERYKSTVPYYTRNIDVALIVYDMTDMRSVETVHEYIRKLEFENTGPYKIIVVGNKCDLLNLQEIYRRDEEVRKELEIYHNVDCYFVSAKTGHNFDKLFHAIETHCESIKEYKDRQKEETGRNIVGLLKQDEVARHQCPCSY